MFISDSVGFLPVCWCEEVVAVAGMLHVRTQTWISSHIPSTFSRIHIGQNSVHLFLTQPLWHIWGIMKKKSFMFAKISQYILKEFILNNEGKSCYLCLVQGRHDAVISTKA